MFRYCLVDLRMISLEKTCQMSFRRTRRSVTMSSSHPRCITVGDMNNDHQMDIIVANSGTSIIGLMFSNVDGTFEELETISTHIRSRLYSIVVTHLNNDQYLDIVVAYYDTNNIGIFFGYGNGRFNEENKVSVGCSHPFFVTIAHLNNDNQTDLIIANYDIDSISILLGYGNGSFKDQIIYSTDYDSHPSSIEVADLNEDNQLDLVVTNSGTNNLVIYLGYGNGRFAKEILYAIIDHSNPTSLVIADLNNDHQLDIGVANNGTGTIGIFLGYGNGSFQSEISYSLGFNSHPQFITSGYFNKDNILDLAIIDSKNDQIDILLGDENVRFAMLTRYDTISNSNPIWMSVIDVNNNNQSDVVIVLHDSNSIVVLIDYLFEPSARQTNYGVQQAKHEGLVAISDLNNDSILDIVFEEEDKLSILFGLGNGSFNGDKISSIENARTQYICVEDLNNDNQSDIIELSRLNDRIDIFIGYGNGTFAPMKSHSTGIDSNPVWMSLGDVNDDHILDIVCANTGFHSRSVFLGHVDGTFDRGMHFVTMNPFPVHSVALGDINNDNHLDAVVVDKGGKLTCFFGVGNGSFIFEKEYIVNSMGTVLFSVALAHFNDDKYLDVVVADTFDNNIAILLGYANGMFGRARYYPTGSASQPYYVIIADLNNDHISDIATTNVGNDEVVVFYGQGNGSFQLSRIYSTGFGSKPYGMAIDDLNNDKQLEIVVGLSNTAYVAVLTEYIAAKFVEQTIYSAGSALYSVSVAVNDFDNNNQSDIVVANSGTNNFHVLFGSKNGIFDTTMTYSIDIHTQPRSVITCHINGDNYIDIVSVNLVSVLLSMMEIVLLPIKSFIQLEIIHTHMVLFELI